MQQSIYLSDVLKYPLLSAEDEIDMARRAKAGDQASRDLLIKSNLRFVISVAKSYARDGNLDDLIQQGNMGLIKAANKYDPELGYKFSTYAIWWIKQGILSYFEKQGKIRLPFEQRSLRKEINRIIEQYLGANGKEPSPQYIADKLNSNQTKINYTANKIEQTLQLHEHIKVGSLDKSVGDDCDTDYINIISGDDGRNIVDKIANKSIADIVSNQICELKIDENYKQILKEYHFENRTFKEIAEELGITSSLVKSKYSKGLRFLQKALQERGLDILPE